MNLVSEPFHRFTSCISSPTNNNDGTVPLWSLTVSTNRYELVKQRRDVLGFVYDDVRRSSYKIESFCGHSCRKTGADAIVIRSTNAIIYILCSAMYGMNCMPAVGWGFLPHFVFHRWVVHQTYARPPDDFTSFTIFMTTVVLPGRNSHATLHFYCSWQVVSRACSDVNTVFDIVCVEAAYISPLSTGWSESSYPTKSCRVHWPGIDSWLHTWRRPFVRFVHLS
jgi:hypothetical protein